MAYTRIISDTEIMLEQRRYWCLKNSTLFIRQPTRRLHEFLQDYKIVNNCNSIELEKFENFEKFVAEFKCGHSRDYTDKIKRMLQNHQVVNVVNNIDMEKIKILTAGIDVIDTIRWLMYDNKIFSAVQSIEVERLRMLSGYDNLYDNLIVKRILDPEAAMASNKLSMKTFALVHDYGKFNGGTMSLIFGNAYYIGIIESIGTDELREIIKNGKLCTKLFGTMIFPKLRKIEVLLNDDQYFHNCPEILQEWRHFNLIEEDKLKLICESDWFDYMIIQKLVKSQEAVKILNTMDNNKLTLFFNYVKDNEGIYVPLLKRLPRFECPKYDRDLENDMRQYQDIVKELFSCADYMSSINLIDIERLELLLKSTNNKKIDLEMLRYLLLQPDICEFIISANIQKFGILLSNYGISSLYYIAASPTSIDLIQSMNLGKFKKTIAMMDCEDFVNLSEYYDDDDVKQNVDFAIVLYEIGQIQQVNMNFLLNKKEVHYQMKQQFPKGFPLDQLLVPSEIKNEGHIANLKYLCMMEYIRLGLAKEQISDQMVSRNRDIVTVRRAKPPKHVLPYTFWDD